MIKKHNKNSKKISLVDQFVYLRNLPIKHSLINDEKLKFNAMINYWGNYRQSDDSRTDFYNYFNLSHDKHVSWLNDFIIHTTKYELDLDLAAPMFRCIVQETNQSINFHNHIDEYNLKDSPSYSIVYTPTTLEKPVELVLKYETGKIKGRHRHIPLIGNQFVLFNSELFHSFTQNENRQHNIIICMHYKLSDEVKWGLVDQDKNQDKDQDK